MIYGQQSVCQPASQPAKQPVSQSTSRPTDRPTNQPASQPAGRAASRTSTACTIPCASAINAGIILIRSILGSGLASLRFRLYPRTQLLSRRRESRRWREALPRRRGKAGEREARRRTEERRPREDRGEGRGELLDRELVACSLKKNWKSVALDGPGHPRRGELREGQLRGTVGSSASSFLTVRLRPSLASSFLSSFSSAKRSR